MNEQFRYIIAFNVNIKRYNMMVYNYRKNP